MHCDSNENGVRDEGEQIKKVKIMPKKGCRVKKPPSMKCQKVVEDRPCFCADQANAIAEELKNFNDNGDDKAFHQPKITCVSGKEKEDLWIIEAVHNESEEVCKSEEISTKFHVCERKLTSVVKTLLKKAKKTCSV